MGKKGGSSWLALVRKAFRSPPSKDPHDSRQSNTRRDVDVREGQQVVEKREKKRWLFRKHTCGNTASNAGQQSNLASEQRHAIAVAAAATIIQAAFRGYLARRALQALKGIVKLQALVRGHNVRKQAKSTLKCMEALLRVQNRVRNQRARLSHEGSSRKSMFADSNNMWESKYLQDNRDWDECPRTLQELDSLIQARKEAHQKTLASAFSQQWESSSSTKDSSDVRRSELIKIVEIDTSMPHRNSSSSVQRPQRQQQQHQPPPVTPSPSKMRPLQVRSASPRSFREERSCSAANTPNLGSARRLSSCIPRHGAEASACSVAIPNYMATTESAKARLRSQSAPRQRPSTPEREKERERERGASAKKRLLYHHPVPDPYYRTGIIGCGGFGKNLRNSSFKSVEVGYVGMEQGSNMSSESNGGDQLLSPCSTTDLRRWIK